MVLDFGLFGGNITGQHGEAGVYVDGNYGNLALQGSYSIYDPDARTPTATGTFTAIYDGSLATQYNLAWAGSSSDVGILIDLVKPYQITSILAYVQPTLANCTVYLASSLDGTTYTARQNTGVLAANAYFTLTTAGYKARYIRLYGNNSAANFSLNIIQVEIRSVE